MYSDSTFDSELKLLTVYMMSYCDDRSSVSEHWTRFLWLLMTQHLWFIDVKSEQSSSHLVVLSHFLLIERWMLDWSFTTETKCLDCNDHSRLYCLTADYL